MQPAVAVGPVGRRGGEVPLFLEETDDEVWRKVKQAVLALRALKKWQRVTAQFIGHLVDHE